MPPSLGVPRGRLDHPPHRTVTLRIAPQHAQELAHGQGRTPGPTRAAIAGHRGGIHHRGGEPVPLQKSMAPAAVTPRCITTHQRGDGRQTTALFGRGDCLAPARLGTRGDRARTRFLSMPRGATERPGRFTPCKGHTQHARRCGLRAVVGRCGRQAFLLQGGAFPPGLLLEEQLPNSDPLSQSTCKHSIYPLKGLSITRHSLAALRY